jgi:hypothetical protein
VSALEQEAARLGKEAFLAGDSSTPVKSLPFWMFLHAHADEPFLPLLKAWTNAWHKANLEAPVPA